MLSFSLADDIEHLYVQNRQAVPAWACGSKLNVDDSTGHGVLGAKAFFLSFVFVSSSCFLVRNKYKRHLGQEAVI